jgi:hypothetical protein
MWWRPYCSRETAQTPPKRLLWANGASDSPNRPPLRANSLLCDLVDQVPEFLRREISAHPAQPVSDFLAHSFFPARVLLSERREVWIGFL